MINCVYEDKIWFSAQNIILKSVITKYFEGVKIWVYVGQIIFYSMCTIRKSDERCDHSWL